MVLNKYKAVGRHWMIGNKLGCPDTPSTPTGLTCACTSVRRTGNRAHSIYINRIVGSKYEQVSLISRRSIVNSSRLSLAFYYRQIGSNARKISHRSWELPSSYEDIRPRHNRTRYRFKRAKCVVNPCLRRNVYVRVNAKFVVAGVIGVVIDSLGACD